MSGPNDRITTAISTKELERRWAAAARKEMRERGIDALVMQNNSDWLGGYVKWFTDIPATNGYPKTVVFHANEPMTMVEMGGFNTVRNLKGTDPVHRGIGELLGSPSFLAVNYTDNYHTDCIVPGLKKYSTIGLVGPGSMPHAFVMRLKETLPGAKFVDTTEFVDHPKAIKSAEEIVLIMQCGEIQDPIFDKVAAAIKPGMRDIDVTGARRIRRPIARQRAGHLPRLLRPGRPARALRAPSLPEPHDAEGRPPHPADREQRPRRLLRRNRAHPRDRQGVERPDRRFHGDERGADPHAGANQARRVVADIAKAHNTYMKQRGLSPRPALRAQPGLRPGRAADDARRRDHAAGGKHELRRASRLQHVDDVDRRSATTTWSRPTASAPACTRPRRRFSRSTDDLSRPHAEEVAKPPSRSIGRPGPPSFETPPSAAPQDDAVGESKS